MAEAPEFVYALYWDFFERGIRYFFPEASFSAIGKGTAIVPTLNFSNLDSGELDLEWMGTRYRLACPDHALSADQLRLVASIGAVLSARYRGIFSPVSNPSATHLFQGVAEDRYISAFLDHTPYLDGEGFPTERDVIADAIDVLRQSSLVTYENQRVSTGVILTGSVGFPNRPDGDLPFGALRYTSALVSIKSFSRLCDGLSTVFLVDQKGMLLDLVDIEQFARACSGAKLPAPSAARYHSHCRATLRPGQICLILTPNGEIKIFAGGAQIFQFLEGRWHLTDVAEKYHVFERAIGDAPLAERLFSVGLNLAEKRRGGLFVLLDRDESVQQLVSPGDFLDDSLPAVSTKGQIHYLLSRKHVMELEPSVLQSIARVDGGIVMDRGGRLLAFGAILRAGGEPMAAQDGGRTTAAFHASRFGLALKVSEDGMLSFYRGGAKVWDI
ncbi:MAG: DNA integrity scanning protein DisA nucleotide-binding domain protein [Acidobacteriia bacterium]|nr:DNA integrity scanning protein DisA nucleotide-binding domain protein [Terriglobia bacterium]